MFKSAMDEFPIAITALNDFIFCPASLYFHSLDNDTDNIAMQDCYQIDGSAAHNSIDTSKYSSRKNILQGVAVYSEKYNLYGKIDIFDIATGILTERKKKIVNIYDGYVFQVYAQYFAMTEMGYKVEKIKLYSLDDNKSYYIPLPDDDIKMLTAFESTIDKMRDFDIEAFVQGTPQKCNRCIYEPLCSFSKKEA